MGALILKQSSWFKTDSKSCSKWKRLQCALNSCIGFVNIISACINSMPIFLLFILFTMKFIYIKKNNWQMNCSRIREQFSKTLMPRKLTSDTKATSKIKWKIKLVLFKPVRETNSLIDFSIQSFRETLICMGACIRGNYPPKLSKTYTGSFNSDSTKFDSLHKKQT